MPELTLLKADNRAAKKMILTGTEGDFYLESIKGTGLVSGSYQTISLATPEDLATLLRQNIHSPETLMLTSTFEGSREGPITTWTQYTALGTAAPVNMRTRTKHHLAFRPGTGFVVVDCDVKDADPLDVHKRLSAHLPMLATVPFVVTSSSRTHLYAVPAKESKTKKAVCLCGAGGFRLYYLVNDTSLTSEVGDLLFAAAFLEAGEILIDKCGRMHARSYVDKAMFRSTQPDYVGGVYTESHVKGWALEQRRPYPVLHNADGASLDCAKFVEENKKLIAKYNTKFSRMRSAKAPEAEVIIQKYAKELPDKPGMEYVRKLVEDPESPVVLYGEFRIMLDTGEEVPVKDILKTPEQYHMRLTHDPIEPEYDDYRVVGKLFLMGKTRPLLHSFAHGDRNYYLDSGSPEDAYQMMASAQSWDSSVDIPQDSIANTEEAPEILYNRADGLADPALRGADVLSAACFVGTVNGSLHMSAHGKSLRRVDGGDAGRLVLEVEQRVKFLQVSRSGITGGVHAGLRAPLLTALSDKALPVARIMDFPTVTVSGKYRAVPGYDPETRVYLNPYDKNIHPEPRVLTNDRDVQRAMQIFLEPFRAFEFMSPADYTALVGACFTAINRIEYSTSPAFLVNTSSVGAGKTKLSTTLCLYAMERPIDPEKLRTTNYPSNDADVGKELFAYFTSAEPYFLLDNVNRVINNETLASLLTSPYASQRRFGKNDELLSVETRKFVVLNGKGLGVTQDLSRRFVECTLLPAELKQTHLYDFDCVTEACQNLPRIRQAGQSLLMTFAAARQAGWVPRQVDREYIPLASFEDWDQSVRQCVLWLGSRGLLEVGDILTTRRAQAELDPALEEKVNFFKHWCCLFNRGAVLTASDLIAFLYHTEADMEKLTPAVRRQMFAIGTEKETGNVNPDEPLLVRQAIRGLTQWISGGKGEPSAKSAGMRLQNQNLAVLKCSGDIFRVKKVHNVNGYTVEGATQDA